MKLVSLVLAASLLMASTSFAGADDEYAALVGKQTIARSVVAKKLVDRESREAISLALETGKAKLGTMECDRATGKDVCVIELYILDDETTPDAEEALYFLRTTIIQGTVVAAELELVAG